MKFHSKEAFTEALTGARLLDVTYHGKWLLIETAQSWLLLNLGMGGEILLDDSFFLVGYREGQPCPRCGTTIEKIRTGSTNSYVCPACQPLEMNQRPGQSDSYSPRITSP